MKRLTYQTATRLFGNPKEHGMELSLHNIGDAYQVRNQDGDVLFTHEEYLTCVAYIRRQQPELPPGCGFAPAPATESVGTQRM